MKVRVIGDIECPDGTEMRGATLAECDSWQEARETKEALRDHYEPGGHCYKNFELVEESDSDDEEEAELYEEEYDRDIYD